jgi:hypothetical protein
MLFSSPAFFIFFSISLLLPPDRSGAASNPVDHRRQHHLLRLVESRVHLVAVCPDGCRLRWRPLDGADGPASGPETARAATVVVLFIPLLVFKYTDFVYRDVIGPLAGWRGSLLNLPLPLGVSFVTFTLTAFVVDSYTRRAWPCPRGSTCLGTCSSSRI